MATTGTPVGVTDRIIGRVTTAPLPTDVRRDHVLVCYEVAPDSDPTGFDAVVCAAADSSHAGGGVPLVLHASVDHLADGDVVRIDPRGYVRTLYRRASQHNALFATDRCNSYCVMCSQPPKTVDESDLIREHMRLIDLIDPETKELGITGGEPTLFKNGFIDLVSACRSKLPNTSLHVLSNGRLFYYGSFAKKLADVGHPDLMLGIPLYSDLDYEHDYVVQTRGAFDETVVGLHNLGRWGVPVEIRVVIHRTTWCRLPQLAEFIYRNLSFANHVTFMGLEVMGFAIANLQDLWIDPWDYRSELEAATLALVRRGMNVSIYNHQLCTIPESLWPYARRSISDWKNDYLPQCEICNARSQCAGFFSSSIQRGRYSERILPC